mmetsp:Transcript_8739/g.18873  ORF Transcript_8739/g.18873 Transcript_8739/m.18873 type:complete len:686 (+) Transcript_8739:344-2401(+)
MLLPVKSLQLVTILYWGFLLSFNSYIVNGLSGKEPFLHRRLVDSPRDSKMTADATSTTTTKTKTKTNPIVANRLFLSHIDYTNHDEENTNGEDLSPKEVKQQLEKLFSKFGSVLDIYLSEKDKKEEQKEERPPFGFIAMETAEEALAALNEFSSGQQQDKAEQPNARRLFRGIDLANVKQSKNNKQNKNVRLQSERLQEYRKRSALVDGNDNAANFICQVHASHLDRLRDFVSAQPGVSPIGSFSEQKTSFVMLRATATDGVKSNNNDNDGSNRNDDDYLERLSQTVWNTWFVAPNLNRLTILDEDSSLVEGNIRTGVVPAIFRSLSKVKEGDADAKVLLRLAIFPPKLQWTLLDGLEDYNNKRLKGDTNDDCCQGMDIELSPGNPTHTISIVQLHPGVIVTPKSKGDNDKALYVVGRLENVRATQKRSLENNNKHHLQQQSTSVVPQPKKQHKNDSDGKEQKATTAHNSNLKVIDSNSENDMSICRAYWKLQEAWERYQYEPPCLDGIRNEEPMWALDCGAAPGGWTKFLFRPGVVGKIYAVDPGKLSPEVVPGLDESLPNGSESSPIIQHVESTIQKALPKLASDLRSSSKTNKFLDIWVSDMCVKDMSGQIDCFLQAKTEGVIGPGTFFVLTLKCVVGHTATAFDFQAKEQVARLEGISKDVQVVHLFFNRSSERTIIGYLS